MILPEQKKAILGNRLNWAHSPEARHVAEQTVFLQPGFGLIAVRSDDLKIVACGGVATDLLDHSGFGILGKTLAEVSPDLTREIRRLNLQRPVGHTCLDVAFEQDTQVFDTVVHRQAGTLVIEFVPGEKFVEAARKSSMRLASKARANILRAETLEIAALCASEAIRRITGYDTVKVIHTDASQSGKTTSESKLNGQDTHLTRTLKTFMGYSLWWSGTAASDLLTTGVETLAETVPDMSHALSRAVPRSILDVFDDADFHSILAFRLSDRDRDFGMIVGENSSAKTVACDDWYLIEELGTALMQRQQQLQDAQITEKIWRLRRIENRFAGVIRHGNAMEDVIHVLIPIFRGLLGAEGFAFKYRAQVFLSGRTPPQVFVDALLSQFKEKASADTQYSTTELYRDWAPALNHIDTACGVLIQQINLTEPCFLIWFRGPESQSEDTQTNDQAERSSIEACPTDLSSTATYGKTRRGAQSKPWSVSEQTSVQKVFSDYLEVLATQFALKEENLALQRFAEHAVHDIKEPLRGITIALNMMEEDAFGPETVRLTHELATNSARRLSDLTRDLLDFADLNNECGKVQATELGPLVQSAIDMVRPQLNQLGANIRCAELPIWPVHKNMLIRLFLNLISNALKYKHPDRPPKIDVTVQEYTDTSLEIAISDNGLGVPRASAQKIFEPLKRLHRQDEIEGSGLGLNICARIAEAHNGSITLDQFHSPGARFVVRLRQ